MATDASTGDMSETAAGTVPDGRTRKATLAAVTAAACVAVGAAVAAGFGFAAAVAAAVGFFAGTALAGTLRHEAAGRCSA